MIENMQEQGMDHVHFLKTEIFKWCFFHLEKSPAFERGNYSPTHAFHANWSCTLDNDFCGCKNESFSITVGACECIVCNSDASERHGSQVCVFRRCDTANGLWRMKIYCSCLSSLQSAAPHLDTTLQVLTEDWLLDRECHCDVLGVWVCS